MSHNYTPALFNESQKVSRLEKFKNAPSSEYLTIIWEETRCNVYLDKTLLAKWCAQNNEVNLLFEKPGNEKLTTYFELMFFRAWLEFNGGGTLHASAMEYKNKALVFIGPSGVGKSTLYGFAEPPNRLCDELCNVIKDNQNNWVVKADDGRQVPIAALIFPEHAETYSLTAIKSAISCQRILFDIYPGIWFQSDSSHSLAFSCGLVENIPCYLLKFLRKKNTLTKIIQEILI